MDARLVRHILVDCAAAADTFHMPQKRQRPVHVTRLRGRRASDKLDPTATYLGNQLLVAMPSLKDSQFAGTVTLLCEHSERGALGIVLNQPLKMNLAELLAHLKLPPSAPGALEQPVLRGGPVQTDRGFVLHRPLRDFESTLRISDTLHVTTSRDVLVAMAAGEGPSQAVVALGYAGWEAGQLEAEIRENAWLTAPVDDRLVFDIPFAERWQAAAGLLGIELSRLAPTAGRA
jgi:putative transcriptional regulator